MEYLNDFMQYVHDNNIKMVAFDLDRTMVADHSGGFLKQNEVKLYTDRTTECTKQLIMACLDNKIQVSVVTFSDAIYSTNGEVCGKPLVVEVLRTFLSDSDIAQITVIALNSDIYNKSKLDVKTPFIKYLDSILADKTKTSLWTEDNKKFYEYPPKPYKEFHLKLVSRLSNIDLKNICLIDDSMDNCKNAKSLGCKYIFVNGINGLLYSHLKLIQ